MNGKQYLKNYSLGHSTTIFHYNFVRVSVDVESVFDFHSYPFQKWESSFQSTFRSTKWKAVPKKDKILQVDQFIIL